VIVVADSTKFGHQSLALLCPIEEVNRLVVDEGVTSEWRDKLAAAEVQLLVAGDA
jgi:DeoR family transcriptional regulator, fructose operon transcriptional repressor